MISAESIKRKLKNIAVKENSTMQNELILYALERAIYRLSISEYADSFVLKGGIFLYALFNRNFSRTTQDIDLLAKSISNEENNLKSIFNEIFSISCDDALYYDLSSLKVRKITELKEYHGVNVSIISYLDKTRIPVSIDIGFGDIVYPDKLKMDFPTLLEMESPKVYVYSIYSFIAEKFEAIVSLGLINSRYKDFYDIYAIGKIKIINGKELQNAIKETFKYRKTGFDDIVAFKDEYIYDKLNQNRRNSFIMKKQISETLTFEEIIKYCKKFLMPIVDSINKNLSFEYIWNFSKEIWIKR